MNHSTQRTQFERLALAARRIGGGILAEPPPRLPLGGTELTGYRDYTAGDDYRHVDWNVCARHDELRVRVFGGHRDRHVRLLVDGSASMHLGSTAPRFQTAQHVAAAVGYMALLRQSRLSVFAFSDRLEQRIGPLRGKGRVGQLLRELGRWQPGRRATDFRQAAESFARIDPTAGPVVIISDFCEAQSFQPGLDILRVAGHSPRVIQLVDPGEDDHITQGDIVLADVEGGHQWQVTLTKAQLQHYRRLAAEDRQQPRSYCKKYRLPYVCITGSFEDDLSSLRTQASGPARPVSPQIQRTPAP